MLAIRRTFEIVTPASAEYGDVDRRGWTDAHGYEYAETPEPEPTAFRDLLDLLRYTEPSCCPLPVGDLSGIWCMEADPHEVKNLAGDPAHADTLKDLRARLSKRVKNLPDLSMFPESVMVAQALGDPIAFGKKHADEISRLVDVADLALLEFERAEPKLVMALLSDDPWTRYWALTACALFGEKANHPSVTVCDFLENRCNHLAVQVLFLDRFKIFFRSTIDQNIRALSSHQLIKFIGQLITPKIIQRRAAPGFNLFPHLQPVGLHQIQGSQ